MFLELTPFPFSMKCEIQLRGELMQFIAWYGKFTQSDWLRDDRLMPYPARGDKWILHSSAKSIYHDVMYLKS